ncbi:hypothetical protein B296_00020252, partial [Ensete ventricosum]
IADSLDGHDSDPSVIPVRQNVEWSITHRVHNPYSEYAPAYCCSEFSEWWNWASSSIRMSGLHLLVDGKFTLMRRYDKSVACSSFSGGFSLRSELSPRCDLLGLGDQPNLNSAKRAHSLSSICISKASNLVPIRSIDALAGYDGQGLRLQFCDSLRFRLPLVLRFEGVVAASKGFGGSGLRLGRKV